MKRFNLLILLSLLLTSCNKYILEYEEINNGYSVLGILNSESNQNIKSINIPNLFNDKPVLKISNYAFDICKIKSINFGDNIIELGDESICGNFIKNIDFKNITKIGTMSCGLNPLTNIDSKNIMEIGELAFYSCSKLTNITIQSKLQYIGELAFFETSLKEIYIPKTVITIKKGAFKGIPNLTINCENEAKPSSWDNEWCDENTIVNWNYKL